MGILIRVLMQGELFHCPNVLDANIVLRVLKPKSTSKTYDLASIKYLLNLIKHRPLTQAILNPVIEIGTIIIGSSWG